MPRTRHSNPFSEYAREHGLGTIDYYLQHHPELVGEQDAESLKTLLEGARTNVFGIYTATYAFLKQYIKNDDAILKTIQASSCMARRFGSLDETQASKLASNAITLKDELFDFVENEAGELIGITFREEAEAEWINEYVGKAIGCTALAFTVKCPYSKEHYSVYDLFWQAFTAEAHRLITSQ